MEDPSRPDQQWRPRATPAIVPSSGRNQRLPRSYSRNRKVKPQLIRESSSAPVDDADRLALAARDRSALENLDSDPDAEMLA